MDRILIRELAVDYRVGVPEAERARPQRLLLNIEIEHDFHPAVAADDLGQTIDYNAVTRRLLAYGEGRSWRLIESLAVDLAELVLREFGGQTVAVEVQKFILPETRYVAVSVRREREGLSTPSGQPPTQGTG